jgi:predicted DNA-binding transcriptional regulator YafY
MTRRTDLAAASRDSQLALRRVERQQTLIERLHAAHGGRVQLDELAADLHVSTRTLVRDVERLRLSGVPISAHRGRGGGLSLPRVTAMAPIVFDLPEAAALMSSLTVLGPSVTSSATSAMSKLVAALQRGPASQPSRPAP